MRLGLLAVVLALAGGVRAQEQAWRDSAAAFWSRTEAEFADSATSPLKAADRAVFHGLERFPYDPAFHVTARFTPTPDAAPFGMVTTTARRPQYQACGRLTFTLQGRACTLIVYRNLELARDPAYANYLFLPFTDGTSGEETYGGGRYIDLQGPLGPTVEVDFNTAYNPYCAYNDRYSCPVPPKENVVDLPVRAGVRKYHD